MVALAIVYLIKPSLVREWSSENLQKIKTIASKIYNLYILNKSGRNWILMIYIFIVFLFLSFSFHLQIVCLNLNDFLHSILIYTDIFWSHFLTIFIFFYFTLLVFFLSFFCYVYGKSILGNQINEYLIENFKFKDKW
jgi:hypothetical protein